MFDKPAAAITWEYRHILHKRHSKKHHQKWIWFVIFSFWNILEFWSNPELDGQGTFKRPSAITSNAPESCNRSSTLVGQIAGLDGMDLEKTTSDINQTNAPQKKNVEHVNKNWESLSKQCTNMLGGRNSVVNVSMFCVLPMVFLKWAAGGGVRH